MAILTLEIKPLWRDDDRRSTVGQFGAPAR
jgi:hypothetical protein